MRRLFAYVVAVFFCVLAPRLVQAQELKTINKPGVMQANVSSEDENKKPLKLKKGEKVTVIYSRDDWMWVKAKSGRGGWVLKKEVKVEDTAAAAPAGGEDAKKKKEEDAAAKKAAAEEAKKKKEDAAAAKKAAAEEAKRKKEEAAAAKKAAAEEAKRKKEDAAAAKKAAAEEAKRKKEEEAAAKKAGTETPKPAPAEEPAKAAPVVATPAPVQPTPEPAPMPAPETQPAPQPVAMVQPVAPAPVVPMAPVAVPESAPAPMAAGFLTVIASEPGAAVILDGRRVGDAPIRRLAVEGGRHQVAVMKDEFAPTTQDVEINGNEATASLALAPSPDLVSRHRTNVFIRWGAGFGVLAVGAGLSLLSSAVGVGGAMLWIASSVAAISEKTTVDYKDPLSAALAPVLGGALSPVTSIGGAALTFAGPALALLCAVGGAVGAAALFMTAGDVGRYSAYQE
ncbi:MAG: PEGA domain-containing protein [Deltaproteobacteria bacterium]|nr:PEGA domain-containing protein [Deltaproteobacteria bacterium]